jgi:hypothetical protein
MHGMTHIIKNCSKMKVVFAMSLCRLVYIGDGAEVLAGSSLEVSWLME